MMGQGWVNISDLCNTECCIFLPKVFFLKWTFFLFPAALFIHPIMYPSSNVIELNGQNKTKKMEQHLLELPGHLASYTEKMNRVKNVFIAAKYKVPIFSLNKIDYVAIQF